MTRMTLALLVGCLLACSANGEEQAQAAQQSCQLVEAKVTELTSKLAAAQEENAALQKQVEAASGLPAQIAAAQEEKAALQKQIQAASGLPAQIAAAQEEKAALQQQVEASSELPAQLVAALAENSLLQKQAGAASEVPYLSAGAIVDSLGSVRNLAFAKRSLSMESLDLTHVYKAADASIEALQAARTQATAAASKHGGAASEALFNAVDMAKELHGKHIAEHTQEYYQTTLEGYTAHVEPQLAVAKKAYYDNVHPHVGTAPETIYAGIGAAIEGGKSLTPKVQELLELITKSLSEALNGQLGEKLATMVEPRTFVVMDRKFKFNHGMFDIALAAVQSLIACYFSMLFLSFFLKNIVWKVGIKLLGKKLFFGLTRAVVKVTFSLARILLSIVCYVVFTVLALLTSWMCFAICSGLGVGLLHAIEKNFSVGITTGIRLAAGVAIGVFVYVLFRCTCCKKRKGKDAKATNGKAKAKAAAKQDAKAKTPDAKQAPKPTKKK